MSKVKQMKFKIWIRKTSLADYFWNSTTLRIFRQDKRKLLILDSRLPLQSLLITTPQRVYQRDFLGWIDKQIFLTLGLRSRARGARYKFYTVKPRVTKNNQSGKMPGSKIRAEKSE